MRLFGSQFLSVGVRRPVVSCLRAFLGPVFQPGVCSTDPPVFVSSYVHASACARAQPYAERLLVGGTPGPPHALAVVDGIQRHVIVYN